MKFESGGFEATEIAIQRGEGKPGADGERGEVSVHPDLGRCGGDGGKFEPQLTGALRFGIETADVRHKIGVENYPKKFVTSTAV